MLELIFRGFLEWVYVLLVEMWGFIADGLLDIMSLDFAYLQTHIPIIGQIEQLLMAAGWALLLGNLVFQALKSMAAGLGFEGEDPKLLFSRTFIFAFLLLASPQICRIGLDLTSNVMALLSVPDAADVELVSEGVFGTLTAAWLMAMICSVIVMFKVLGLVVEIAERYVILAMLAITAPLAFAMGGSKNTASIFSGWCRMFGSMCLLMVTNLVCFKMLFSALSTVPSGLDVLPWMVLIFAIVKVAKKSDAIITRIGLNPAITGGPGKNLPGMLAYTVARSAVSQVANGVGGGSGAGGKAAKPSPGASKSSSFFNRFGGSSMGGGRYSSQSSGSTGGSYTYNASSQSGFQQTGSQQSGTNRASAPQNGTAQENTSHTSTQQTASGGTTFNTSNRASAGDGRWNQQTRRSSVPPGARRSPGYVPSSTAGTAVPQPPGNTYPGPAGTAGSSRGTTPNASVPRPGSAGNPPKGTPPQQPKGAQPGPAGTGTHSQSTRSTHSASQVVGGGTVNNNTQTNVTVGKGSSGATAPRQPHPGGSAASAPPKPGKVRSTKRESTGAVLKTSAAPSPGGSQPGTAGKPTRSTQRPPDPAPRPGRNVPPATAAPQAGGASSGTVRQERASRPSCAAGNGTSPDPARQEQRKSAVPASPTMKGGTPNVRPGPAGTAQTGKQAASTKRPAAHSSKRANPVRRPASRNRGGIGRGG